jgi:hypothetical protein
LQRVAIRKLVENKSNLLDRIGVIQISRYLENEIFDVYNKVTDIGITPSLTNRSQKEVERHKRVVPNCIYNPYTTSVIYVSSMTAKAQGCCERYSLGHSISSSIFHEIPVSVE